jgi:hypothetical protein
MINKFIFLHFALVSLCGCANQSERPQYPDAQLEQLSDTQYGGYRKRTDTYDVLIQLLWLNR